MGAGPTGGCVRDRAAPCQIQLVRRVRAPGAALTILATAQPFAPAVPTAPAEFAATP